MAPLFDPFIKKLQQGASQGGHPGQIILWFDSLLADLKQMGTVAEQVGAEAAAVTHVQSSLEHMKTLSEIDQQLFLQFLEAEIMFLRGHRILKGIDLYRRLEHDRQISQKKQAEIRAALIQVFQVEEIDQAFTSALAAQRFQTFKTFLAMKLQPLEPVYPFMPGFSVDEYLHGRETNAVRKILEQLLEFHAQSSVFNAHAAWIDLKQRWDIWARNYGPRIGAFKKLWAATGGGRDVRSNLQAEDTIKHYYEKLYGRIEASGTFSSLMAAFAEGADPWS